MTLKADVIIWDLHGAVKYMRSEKVMVGELVLIHRLKQHLGKVQAIGFSCCGSYLCTLGGQDDNAVVVWSLKNGEAVCGSPAAPDCSLCCIWFNKRSDRFITAGNYHLKVWQVDFKSPKLHAIDAKLGSLRRIIPALSISPDDKIAYCGTTSGDVLKVNIERDELRAYNDPDIIIPSMIGCTKEKVSKGIKSILCVFNEKSGNINVIVGGGDGNVRYINPSLNMVGGHCAEVLGSVTSLSLHPLGQIIAVGTDQCNRYELSLDLSKADLKASCHFGCINNVLFPNGSSDLMITCSMGDIRIWNIQMKLELLRIQVPNLNCLCFTINSIGSTIVSGWDDGKIRAFFPESGKMKFVIPDAHSDNVTSLAIANDIVNSSVHQIISGGSEGRLRVWDVTSSHQALKMSLKEHRGAINCIKINTDNTQCISASSDGSCIVWDLKRFVRVNAFFESNVFYSVLYHPDESQIITCGSNHKITYWDSVDGQAIRVIDGGDSIMTCLDVDDFGNYFVSGSEDRKVKIWHYDNGIPLAIGEGHSGILKSIQISPDCKSIASVGSSGEIIIWDMSPFRSESALI